MSPYPFSHVRAGPGHKTIPSIGSYSDCDCNVDNLWSSGLLNNGVIVTGGLLLGIIPGTLPQVVLLYSRKDLEHVSL